MKKIIIFLSCLLITFITGCTKDLPLSDLDLTDPDLIKPDIQISRSLYPSGTISFSHTVWIFIKNNNSINIQNGKVEINNIPLSLKKETINDAPYYSMDPANLLTYEFNKTYTCDIFLRNGKVYSSTVKSRKPMSIL